MKEYIAFDSHKHYRVDRWCPSLNVAPVLRPANAELKLSATAETGTKRTESAGGTLSSRGC